MTITFLSVLVTILLLSLNTINFSSSSLCARSSPRSASGFVRKCTCRVLETSSSSLPNIARKRVRKKPLNDRLSRSTPVIDCQQRHCVVSRLDTIPWRGRAQRAGCFRRAAFSARARVSRVDGDIRSCWREDLPVLLGVCKQLLELTWLDPRASF